MARIGKARLHVRLSWTVSLQWQDLVENAAYCVKRNGVPSPKRRLWLPHRRDIHMTSRAIRIVLHSEYDTGTNLKLLVAIGGPVVQVLARSLRKRRGRR